jgi:hypothetical protein
MFKTISWQEFTVAVSVAAACYYAFIVVVFYRRDIVAKLRGEATSSNRAKPIRPQTSPRNFMGAVSTSFPVRKKPVTESSANAEEVEVAEITTETSAEPDHSAPADELLQELGNLFEIMKEGKPSQDAYLKNMKTLFAQYVHLIGPEEFTKITYTIIQELKTKHDIFLSTEIIEELWPKEKVKHSNHSK